MNSESGGDSAKCSKCVTIVNRFGLHARAAARFVTEAKKFPAEIQVCCNTQSADGKNLLQLMLLAAACGAVLEIRASGECAEQAMAALCDLVERRFEEEG